MTFYFYLLKSANTARLFALLIISLIYSACSQTQKANRPQLISFKEVNGIGYTEVHRRSANGLSFDSSGYQQEPQWRMRFLSNDSVSIYSPDKKRYINFLLSRGYDSIFNTARAWLKLKKISRDSLVFQLLTAKNDELDTKGEDVFMTLYADKYIKDVLHTTPAILQRPSRKDTLFIRGLVKKANHGSDSTFAARQPVVFKSKSPLVTVVQKKTVPDFLENNFSVVSDYFEPEYDITINKAYSDFTYTFTIVVDEQGKMHYGKPLVGFLGDNDMRDAYIHLSTAVMNSYLTYYLQVTPGSTLGMPHASVISVNVRGNKISGKPSNKS